MGEVVPLPGFGVVSASCRPHPKLWSASTSAPRAARASPSRRTARSSPGPPAHTRSRCRGPGTPSRTPRPTGGTASSRSATAWWTRSAPTGSRASASLAPVPACCRAMRADARCGRPSCTGSTRARAPRSRRSTAPWATTRSSPGPAPPSRPRRSGPSWCGCRATSPTCGREPRAGTCPARSPRCGSAGRSCSTTTRPASATRSTTSPRADGPRTGWRTCCPAARCRGSSGPASRSAR